MENNDILRRFRYALDIPDSTMVKIFKLAGSNVDEEKFRMLLKKRGEDGYVACSAQLLEGFLDALILFNRGPQSDTGQAGGGHQGGGNKQGRKPHSRKPQPLSNNMILKKLRIALELRQEDVRKIFAQGGLNISKGELSALFRNEGHKNYKPCGDQYLKKFLSGLGVRHRM